MGRQQLGRLGRTDNGVVTVTTVRAGDRVHHPLHAHPRTRAHHFPEKRNDPDTRTGPQLAAALALRAKESGFARRAVAAG